jgi:putative peptide zinc metalloprotease protein
MIRQRLRPRYLIASLALLAAGLVPAAGPIAVRAQGGDQAAVAVNTHDGMTMFRILFSIRRTMSDTVDNTNVAIAFSSCTDCETVAISFETVLILSDPSTYDPTNLAWAQNYMCQDCASFAAAYQYLLTTGGPVHFTAEGNKEIARIRQELESLRHANLTLDELLAKVKQLEQEMNQVIATQLVPAGNSGGTTPAATPSATPAGSASPAASPTPTPTASGSP